MIKDIFHHKKAVAGLVILIALTATALFAPFLAPYDPYEQHIDRRLENPSTNFYLGTDYLGRCVLSRVLYGTRLSLKIAVTIVGIQVLIGLSMGAVAGYFGGISDGLIMRLVDVFMALPSLALALVLAGVLGPGMAGITVAMCATGWAEYARIIRGDILAVKEKEFVKSAQAFGFSEFYILSRHVIPNVLASIIVLATLSTGFVILLVSAFSFIGLGSQPPLADWGTMLNESRAFMRMAPHLTIFPGMAIMLTTLGFNLLGDALRDIMDPRFNLNFSGNIYDLTRTSKS
ncbi:MAG: ABC transporter permease [Desulfobacteraceae bacterium]|nr:ABC transporter permease [Desulfobacteraceae bacterium]